MPGQFRDICCEYCQEYFTHYKKHIESKKHIENKIQYSSKEWGNYLSAIKGNLEFLHGESSLCGTNRYSIYRNKLWDEIKHHKKQFRDNIFPELMAAVWHPRNIARFSDWGIDVDLS